MPSDLRDEEVRYANFSITETTGAGVGTTGVTLAPTTATLDIGDTQQLTPTISPANATDQCVTYSSSDPSVATVTDDGLVSAVGTGTATITITTTDGNHTSTSMITVNGLNTSDCPILVDVKAMLQGAYDMGTSEMTTDLNTATMVPETEPYTASSYAHVGGGGEMTTTAIISANDIVDWVVVELRDKANSASIVATRSALLRKDGCVVDMDGTSSVAFENVVEDDYYIAVRHRNHLGVMTNAAVSLIAGSTTIANILNADFEAGTSDWTNSGLGGTIQTSSSPVYEGLVAGKLPAAGDRIAYQLVTVQPNTNYTLNFWYTIKDTPVGGALTATILDGPVSNPADVAGATITSQTYTVISSNNTYDEANIMFNSGTSSQIAIYFTNAIADCRFDALSLVGTIDCDTGTVDCDVPLSEPGFEDNTDNAGCGTQQNGTDCWENSALGGQIQISTSPVYAGLQAGKLPAPVVGDERIAYQLVNVAPNTNYDLGFWYTIKTTPVGGALTVHILDSHVTNPANVAAATIVSQTYNDQTSSNDYVQETLSFNSGSSSQIAIYMTNVVADCRFDEMTLTRTSVSTPTISEPGFEDNTDFAGCGTQQNGTDCWENSALGGQIQISTSPVYAGLQAGKLPAPVVGDERIAYQLIDVTPNIDYDLSFAYTIKTTPVGASMTVNILDSHVTNPANVAAATITSQTYTDQTSSNDYILETISFNSGTSSQIAIYITNTVADCRFDEMVLTPTGTDCDGGSTATCSDGIQNQGETGVDCGGPCAACPPACDDGIMNGDETGIDCGGATCPACPTCTDGMQNGDETGIDCGGSCPDACSNLCATADYPADNLGTNWKLNGYSGTLNLGATNNGLTYVDNVPGFATHENDNWFYLGDDCWTYFKTYPGNPTSSGSGNPRTELREMVANGSTEISWDGTTVTEHSMIWRVKVDQLSQSGKLCFGQIHAGSGSAFDDVIRVQCQGSANQTSGSVTWRILGYVAEDLLGSGQSVGSFNLGDELYLELTMQNSIVTLYELDSGGTRINTVFTSGAVASTDNYFKAGCYLQSSQGQTANGPTDFGLVGINEITVSH